jgi:hypothetical protein
MDAENKLGRLRKELLGRHFSNRSELRHIAERAGFDFVPVEIIEEGDTEAWAALRPKGLGEVRVRGERNMHYQPFHITNVEAA